ncbi:MAG TPA: hypothetical protein VLU41_14185 [Ideonella sp.]|nr:hypothetical protein [Ideonella sp.]
MTLLPRFVVVAVAAALCATALAQSEPIAARDFTVFVDPPTGFAFVKLPQGWKFVGAVEASDLARLPPTVLTSLLQPAADDPRLARASSGALLAKHGRR